MCSTLRSCSQIPMQDYHQDIIILCTRHDMENQPDHDRLTTTVLNDLVQVVPHVTNIRNSLSFIQ